MLSLIHIYQVEAALFACSYPLSRGVILADEVGIGKTIEAGLVISQRRAERGRRILFIVPANLRNQSKSKVQLQQQVVEITLFTIESELK